MPALISIVMLLFNYNSAYAYKSCLGSDIKQVSKFLDDLQRTSLCKDETDFKACSERFGIDSPFSRQASLEGANLALLAGIKKTKGLSCPLPTKGVKIHLFPKSHAALAADDICFLGAKERAAVVEKEMRGLLTQYQEALDIERARYQKLGTSARGAVLSQHMEDFLGDLERQVDDELKGIESGKLQPKDSKFIPMETSWGSATNRVDKIKLGQLRGNIGTARHALRTLPPEQIETFINKELSLNNPTRSSNFTQALNVRSREDYLKLFSKHWQAARQEMPDFSVLDGNTSNYQSQIKTLNASSKRYPRLAELTDLADHRYHIENASEEIKDALAELDKPHNIKTDQEAIARMKSVVTSYDNIFNDISRPVYEPRDPELFNRIHLATRSTANTAMMGLQQEAGELRRSALFRRARETALKDAGSMALKRGKSIIIKSATGFGTVLTVVDVASAASDVKDIVETVTMDDDGSCLKNETPACQKLLKGIQNNKCEAVPAIELAGDFFLKTKEQQLNDLESCDKFCNQFIKPMVSQIGSRKWAATCISTNGKITGFDLKSKNPSDKESISVKLDSQGQIKTSQYTKMNPESNKLTLYSSLIDYDENGNPIYNEIQDKNKFYKASTKESLQSPIYQNDIYQQKTNWFTFDQVLKCCSPDSLMDPAECSSYGINRTPSSGPKTRKSSKTTF